MYFLLFLLIAMMIMLVVIGTDSAHKRLYVISLILTILIINIGANMADKLTEKVFIIVLLILNFIIILFCLFDKPCIKISINNEKINLNTKEIKKLKVVSDSKDEIESDTEIIIVSDNVVLKKSMFEDKKLKNIKKIYFIDTHPIIDSELYKTIDNRLEFYTSNNLCLLELKRYFIKGDFTNDMKSILEPDEDNNYFYEFTYTKTIQSESNKFSIVDDSNKKVFESVELKVGRDFEQSQSNGTEAIVTDLKIGNTYIITLKESDGKFFAKINEKKS